MYVLIEENPNCAPDERMFSAKGEARGVLRVRLETPDAGTAWCDVAAVDGADRFSQARAISVEDSGAGIAWLIHGGEWGLRFRVSERPGPWSLQNSQQWGLPFLVFDSSGQDVEFGMR